MEADPVSTAKGAAPSTQGQQRSCVSYADFAAKADSIFGALGADAGSSWALSGTSVFVIGRGGEVSSDEEEREEDRNNEEVQKVRGTGVAITYSISVYRLVMLFTPVLLKLLCTN